MSNWELEHRRRIEQNVAKVDKIYQKAAQEAAAIGASIRNFNPDRPFVFQDYPQTKARIDKLLADLNSQVKVVVLNGIDQEWDQANLQHNGMIRGILGLRQPTAQRDLFSPPEEADNNPVLAALFNNNHQARDAFKARKTGREGLNLSQRIWKYTERFRSDLEMSMDDGIRSGAPAAEIARDVRKFLKEPDRVYKRFQMNLRDRNGNVVKDREGKPVKVKQLRRKYTDPETGAVTWKVEDPRYKPGRGVYRSSVKNAQRLTRTENNMAYRTADHLRIQQQNFVVGIEVSLSASHKVLDICDHLQGKYPKEFVYRGWHPHCLCPVKFILKTPAELKADTERILSGQPTSTLSVNQVTTVPDGFTSWINNNRGAINRAETKPYFIQDNYKNGNIDEGLSYKPTQQANAVEAARLQAAEQERIQAAIRAEAERVRLAEEAARRAAEEARLAEEARQAEQERLEAERRELEAQLEREAEERRIEEERQRAARAEIEDWLRKGRNKIQEAETAGAHGPALTALKEAVAAQNPTMATIRYRIVEMNKVLRRMRDQAERARVEAAAATQEAQAARATIQTPTRRRPPRSTATTAAASNEPYRTVFTRDMTDAQLERILRERTVANRQLGFDGYYVEWWEGFLDRRNSIPGRDRRSEILRGIARMDEFTESVRSGNFTSVARDAFIGPQAAAARAAEAATRATQAAARAAAEAERQRQIAARAAEEEARRKAELKASEKELEANRKKKGYKFKMTPAEKNLLKKTGWHGVDNIDSSNYTKLMEGFDLVEFNRELDDLADKFGVKITEKSVYFSGSKFIFAIEGAQQFYLKRTFSIGHDSVKAVSHDYLKIPKALQGQSLTKDLFKALYKQYQNGGIQRIDVHANIDVGSYAWGRYGFVADVYHSGKLQRDAIKSIFSDHKKWYGGNAKEMDEIIAYIAKTPPSEPIDMHVVSGMKGAKEALMSQHWYGHVDLTDPKRRKIFEDYLNGVKKKG